MRVGGAALPVFPAVMLSVWSLHIQPCVAPTLPVLHRSLLIAHRLFNPTCCCSCYLQAKSRARQSGSQVTSPPLSPKGPPVVEGGTAGEEEDAAEVGLSEQQQLAMQQEERILTEQIESLQKEKYAALCCFILFST